MKPKPTMGTAMASAWRRSCCDVAGPVAAAAAATASAAAASNAAGADAACAAAAAAADDDDDGAAEAETEAAPPTLPRASEQRARARARTRAATGSPSAAVHLAHCRTGCARAVRISDGWLKEGVAAVGFKKSFRESQSQSRTALVSANHVDDEHVNTTEERRDKGYILALWWYLSPRRRRFSRTISHELTREFTG